MLIAPKESKAQVLIRYELLKEVLGDVGGLNITGGPGASSYTSVAVDARWTHCAFQ